MRRLSAGLLFGASAYAAFRLIKRDGKPVRASDLPLDRPRSVTPDIWIVDSGPVAVGGLHLPVRMTVVRLPGGDLMLHSPTRYTPALDEALSRLGPIRHLVAPSTAHWQFVASWSEAHPAATNWAVPGLRERDQVRRSGVRLDHDLGDVPPPAWSGVIEQGVIAGGLGFHELYLFDRRSRTLILTDLIENLEPGALPPATALAMRLLGGTSGRTAYHVRAVLRLGGAPTLGALRAMIALAPERVIFAHGRIFDRAGERRLREAFAWMPGARSA